MLLYSWASQVNIAYLFVGRALHSFFSSFVTVVYSATSKRFKKGRLALSSGIIQSFSRFGATLSASLTPAIYAKTSELWQTSAFGLLLGILTFTGMAIYLHIDNQLSKSLGITERQEAGEVRADSRSIKQSVKSFRTVAWVLIILNALGVATFFAFTFQANDLVHNNFEVSNLEAGYYTGCVHLFAGFFIPVFASLIDRYGHRTGVLIVCSLFLLASNLLWTFLPRYEDGIKLIWVPIICITIYFSLSAASTWGDLPLVVDKENVGVAYGIFISLYNAIDTVLFLFFGVLQQETVEENFGYFYSGLTLVIMSVIYLILVVWLYIEDQRSNEGKLAKTKVHRR